MYYPQDSATHIVSKYSVAQRKGFKSHVVPLDTAITFKFYGQAEDGELGKIVIIV